jgi:hypothetical protein
MAALSPTLSLFKLNCYFAGLRTQGFPPLTDQNQPLFKKFFQEGRIKRSGRKWYVLIFECDPVNKVIVKSLDILITQRLRLDNLLIRNQVSSLLVSRCAV